MIIFSKIRKSIDYKDFVTQNVHLASEPKRKVYMRVKLNKYISAKTGLATILNRLGDCGFSAKNCMGLMPIVLLVFAVILAGCGAVPLTGRRQLLLVSDQEIFQAGLTQYNEDVVGAKLSSSSSATTMVS